MSNARLEALLHALAATEDDELDCEAFSAAVCRLVDREVAGTGQPAEPSLATHMATCSECLELYRGLLMVAGLEADDRLPGAEALWAELKAACQGRVPVRVAQSAPGRSVTGPLPRPRRRRRRVLWKAPAWWQAPEWLKGPETWRTTSLATGAVCLALGIGWWQADQRAEALSSAVYWAAVGSEMAENRSPDGSWARALYNPEKRAMFVVAGGFPDTTDKVRCWLVDGKGRRLLAGEYDKGDHDPAWWVIRSDSPMSEFTHLDLTTEPDSEKVLQVTLKR